MRNMSVEVEQAGITVKKSFEPDDFPVPAIRYVIRSDRDEAADIRIVDSVPDDVPPQDIGFHPEYGADFWQVEDGHIVYEREFGAGEEYTTLYGFRNKATNDIERFLSEPTIEAVSEQEPTRHAEAAGEEGAFSDRSSVVEIPIEQVPAVDTAASPPRRGDLSHEALTTVEEIGAGGQAIITEARVPEAKQPPATVALREPDTNQTLTHEVVEEFLSQAELWATIDAREREKQRWADSEHIVGVVAIGDRQPWVAMEYMDGGDLAELLAEHLDGLPVGQALWTGECVCKGLEVAHNLGKVHLDVKPGNVLLREADGWPWPKLADWGLARTLATETGTMEGLSVAYAGPEQFDSETFGDPDQLTDIYQTGALVYALLTGEPPATGGQLEVMKTAIGEEPIAPPSDRRAELPAAVDAAVGLALEREKTDRYSSVSVFGDALHALRIGERLPRDVAARLDE